MILITTFNLIMVCFSNIFTVLFRVVKIVRLNYVTNVFKGKKMCTNLAEDDFNLDFCYAIHFAMASRWTQKISIL